MDSLFDLTASEIGISSDKWDHVSLSDEFEIANGIMKERRYDVLPIKDDQGSFLRFYVTKQWNKFDQDNIVIKDLAELPQIDAETKFIDLLNYFHEAEHKYAILVLNKTPVGLISSVNFSWPEIYFRLYRVLFQFEVQLANWIFTQKSDKEIIESLIHSSDEQNNKQMTIGHFLIDERKGEDNHLREYFFLSSLLNLIRIFSLHEKLGFASKNRFADETKYLSDVRNNIAHPVRRMIKKPEDFRRLKISLDVIREIQGKLTPVV